MRCLLEKAYEPLQRVLPVTLLRPIGSGRDDDHAILGHPLPRQGGEPLFEVLRQGGGPQSIEPQLHGRLDLIHILPARAGRPDEVKGDLLLGDRDGTGDAQHGINLAEPPDEGELHELHDLHILHEFC